MLFLSESIYESRRRLLKDGERGKLGEEEGYRRMLELDAADHISLAGMARLRQAAGDLAGAEAYFWDAIQAQPCLWTHYLSLSQLIESQPGRAHLAFGLAELAFSKILMDDEQLAQIDDRTDPFPAGVLPGNTKAERVGFVVGRLRANRDLEPLEVTARLRPYRLIHQLQEGNTGSEFVDALLREGDSMLPLIKGALRGWAQTYVELEDAVVESALALLGEMGGAASIPDVLEFTARDHVTVSAAAHWALERIVDLHPDEAGRAIAEIASSADGRDRVTVAEKIMRRPGLDPSGSVLVHLTEDLDRMRKADRDAIFPALITVMIAAHGRAGLERARAALRRNHSLLSRGIRAECEAVVQIFSESAIPPPPVVEPSPWTVYDICAGLVSWEDEDGEEDADGEHFEPLLPVHRHATPGRNDPCWCGSGKKYKKCHLESDRSGERGESSVPPG